MDIEQLEKYLGRPDMTIVEAMRRIDENNKRILYIVDEARKLIGSLSDGDIRRWIIRTGEINATVERAMFKNTTYFRGEDCDKINSFFASQIMIDSVPV
ncbi:MAG: CBS domain-containing protein, partial [Selenomonadaceae bacterium]|nr:CBS domain-containing protein [Selenomonadaceae bacterium]